MYSFLIERYGFILKTTFCFLLLFLLFACSGEEKENEVVIKVGAETINKNLFLRQFNLYPEYTSNSTYRSALLQEADKLTEQLYYYIAAERENFDTLSSLRNQFKYILHNEMLKELYNTNVLGKIDVSYDDAWDEYKKENLSVSIRHLFSKDKNRIEQAYGALLNGDSFYSLAAELFTDSALALNGGYLGDIKLTDFDPLVVDSIFNLTIGKFSRPLESTYGFHIFGVDDVKQSVFLDKEYFEQNIEDFKNKVRNRRAVRESALYVKKVLKGKSVNIRGRILAALNDAVVNKIAERNSQTMMLYPNVTNNEVKAITNETALIADSVLVEFNGGSWTVSEFITLIKEMPPMQRPFIVGEQKLAKTIIDKIRDKFLLEEAYRLGIDESKVVIQKADRFRKEVMANEFEKSILLASEKASDPQKWEERKKMLAELKSDYPSKIDTALLFNNLSEETLKKKLPLIKFVMRDQYKW